MSHFCDKCGLCCRLLNTVNGMEAFDRGDGTCKYLHGHLCIIFTERPNICNTEYLFRNYYSKTMTQSEFEKRSFEACMKIKERFYAQGEETSNG